MFQMDKKGAWIDLVGLLKSIFDQYERYPNRYKFLMPVNPLSPEGSSSPGLIFTFDEEIQIRIYPKKIYGQKNGFINGKMNPYFELGNGFSIIIRGVNLEESNNERISRLIKPRIEYTQELLSRTIMFPDYTKSNTEVAEMKRLGRAPTIPIKYSKEFGQGLFGLADVEGDRITVGATRGYINRMMLELEPYRESALTLYS